MGSLSRLDVCVERYLRSGGRSVLPARCHRCGANDALVWWGRYWRDLRTAMRAYRLPIRRVRCRTCGHAPGLLPAFVAAHRLYARALVEAARRLRTTGRSWDRIAGALSTEFLLAPNLMRTWARAAPPAEGP